MRHPITGAATAVMIIATFIQMEEAITQAIVMITIMTTVMTTVMTTATEATF